VVDDEVRLRQTVVLSYSDEENKAVKRVDGSKDEIQIMRCCFAKLKKYELVRSLVKYNVAERNLFQNLIESEPIRMQFDHCRPKLRRLFPDLKPKKWFG